VLEKPRFSVGIIASFYSNVREIPQPNDIASKTPRRPRVAALTNRKIVAAKSALAIVAAHAALTAASCVMVQWLRSRYLSPLSHAGPHLMTFITPQVIVFPMTKVYSVSLCKLWRARITAELMTRSTRRDIALSRFRLGRVAPVASVMCVKSSGN